MLPKNAQTFQANLNVGAEFGQNKMEIADPPPVWANFWNKPSSLEKWLVIYFQPCCNLARGTNHTRVSSLFQVFPIWFSFMLSNNLAHTYTTFMQKFHAVQQASFPRLYVFYFFFDFWDLENIREKDSQFHLLRLFSQKRGLIRSTFGCSIFGLPVENRHL